MKVPHIQTVKQTQVGWTIDLEQWVEHAQREDIPILTDTYMNRRGIEVALREAHVIIKGMSDNAGQIMQATSEETLKNEIRKAINWIAGQGFMSTIIVHLDQYFKFLEEEELRPPDQVSIGLVPEELRGPHYAGMMHNANLYWIHEKLGFALVFNRDEILVNKSNFKIFFDNDKNPRTLTIDKKCSSAPIVDQAVVKITFPQETT